MFQKFFQQLFNFHGVETKGERTFWRFFEACVCVFALQYMWQWAFYIPQLSGVILPLGFAEYFDVSAVMFNHYASYINAVIATIFIVTAYFKIWKWSYLIVVFLFHLQYIARFSQGEISHGSNMVGIGILMLAVAALTFSDDRLRRRFAHGLLIFYVGFGYFTASVCKLVATGFTWVNGNHMHLWLGERKTDVFSQFGAFEFNMLQEYMLEYHWLSTLILVFGLLAEASGVFYWFKKTRPFVGVILIAMHFGILFSMNINFDKYVYILVLLSFPWADLLDKYLFKAPRTGDLSQQV